MKVSPTLLLLAIVSPMLMCTCQTTLSQGSLCNAELYDNATLVGDSLEVKGPSVPWNNGTISTIVTLGEDSCGAPTAVGVEFTDMKMSSLPSAEKTFAKLTPACKNDTYIFECLPYEEHVIKFPLTTNATYSPYKYIVVANNLLGHLPMGVYTAPHFDFLFWKEPEALRKTIKFGNCSSLTPDAYYKANKPIPIECFPDSYVNAVATVPSQGNQLLNFALPEFQAVENATVDAILWKEPSWIWGSYDGRIVFSEQQIQHRVLQEIETLAIVKCYDIIGVPDALPEASNYPTKYCIDATKPGVVRVELTDFKPLPAGCNGTVYDRASYVDTLPPNPGSPILPRECIVILKPLLQPPPAPAPSAAPAAVLGWRQCVSWAVVLGVAVAVFF